MPLTRKISKAAHNVISDKPLNTDRLLSLFLFSVISCMTIAMLFVMSSGFKTDLTASYVDSGNQKAESMARQIDSFIKVRRLQLYSLAQDPILKQGIMQPLDNKGLIEDLLEQYKLIGESLGQVVLDFKGDELFANSKYSSMEVEIGEEVILNIYSEIYKKGMDYHLELVGGKAYWSLSTPIRYGQHVEGVLISFIPIEYMEDSLTLNRISDYRLTLSTLSGETLSWGPEQVDITKTLDNEEGQMLLQYGIDFSELDTIFTNATIRLFASSLVIAIVAIAIAIVLGRWFFVRPIERLQQFATDLSEGAESELPETKRITTELQTLSNQFMEMGKKIRRREKDLILSNEELKRNQDTLVHSEKMAGLGQVTAGVAHEINNPVGFIMNNLTMLQEYHIFLDTLTAQLMKLMNELSEDEKQQHAELLSQIERTLKTEDFNFVMDDLECLVKESLEGADRVKGIIQGLKGYAYSGENVSSVNINDCIESTLKVIWNELKYNCEIEKELHGVPNMNCVGGHINQVLMNLFVNAAHAMRENGGILKIKTYKGNQNTHIEISDTGHGIDPENLKNIFDPFFTTKPVGEGTGLGMSICYDIIKQYKGDIRVSSIVGKGTTFHIRFPIKEG